MTSEPSLRPASDLSPADLADLFNRCYADYFVPLRLTEAALLDRITAYDLDLDASRVLTGPSGPVGFVMLGVRGPRGWIGGMGVAPEARGSGTGQRLMTAALEQARALRLARVDLEVLVQNAPAIRIYEALGFRDRRELEVWVRDPAPVPLGPGAFPVVEVAVERPMRARAAARESGLPWQRDIPVIERARPALIALGVERGSELACWAIYRSRGAQVQILDLASPKEPSAQALADTLTRLIERHPGATLSLVNLPAGDAAGVALLASGFVVRWRQREMSRGV